MLINIWLSKNTMDWVQVLKNPIHHGTPEFIIASKKESRLVNTLVNLPDNLSEYLTKVSIKLSANKKESFQAIIETYATNGITIPEALEIIYFAMQVKEIYSSRNLTIEHILTGVLYFHSKQNLSVSDWQILTNTAQSQRGIKRKYTKNENSFNNN